MGFLKNIFSKKKDEVENVGGMEDFMTLIRVYLQAELAGNLGITNINCSPTWPLSSAVSRYRPKVIN